MGEKAYSVVCRGKLVATFRTEEEAEQLKLAIIDEPELFLDVHTWDPGEFYPYVKFEDADQLTLIGDVDDTRRA